MSATILFPAMKRLRPVSRLAALMAEMRGDGGPPDGHDPEAYPGSAPRLANFIWMVIMVMLVVLIRCSNRHAMTCDALVKNPK